MNALRSVLIWGFTWTYMAAAAILLLPLGVLTGRLGGAYAAGRFGVRILLWLGGIRIDMSGEENLASLTSLPGCIFMANHQSNLDPPVLLTCLPGQIAFLAKKELFAVPVLGAVLAAAGFVSVDRSNREAARASIVRAAQAARAGRPFLIFPEGTRSRDGQLLPFRKGAFHFAEQAGVPVVAVSISGTGALMPRGQWRIRAGRVRIHVHSPTLAAEWEDCPEPRVALMERVRQQLAME